MFPGPRQRAVLMVAILWTSVAGAQNAPHRATDYLQAGINQLKGGDFRAAEVQLQKALQLDPKNPEVYNLLGFVDDQTGRPQQAIHNYEEALTLAPNYSAARNNLGSAYLRMGKAN